MTLCFRTISTYRTAWLCVSDDCAAVLLRVLPYGRETEKASNYVEKWTGQHCQSRGKRRRRCGEGLSRRVLDIIGNDYGRHVCDASASIIEGHAIRPFQSSRIWLALQ